MGISAIWVNVTASNYYFMLIIFVDSVYFSINESLITLSLNPNLGVVFIDNKEIIIADIPGLIEGAHSGSGLGDKFLKHIERCKIGRASCRERVCLYV